MNVALLTVRKSGREQGSFESKIAIAKKMKAKGMNLEDIAEMTGLTKEELQNLS